MCLLYAETKLTSGIFQNGGTVGPLLTMMQNASPVLPYAVLSRMTTQVLNTWRERGLQGSPAVPHLILSDW